MLKDKSFLTDQEEAALVKKTHEAVTQAFEFARTSAYPQAADALLDVFVQEHSHNWTPA
jgi:TPP-dependent pyruvate/acetoin dehydrogenase alpha subunit